MIERDPPYSISAEQAVLGVLLADNPTYDRIYDLVGEHDFYRSTHRAIWRAISGLIEKNRPADVITVAEALQQDGQLEECGGLSVLGSLSSNAPAPINARHHALIVRDRAILRRLAAAALEITELAFRPGADPQEAAEQAEAKVLAVQDGGADLATREPESLKLAVFEARDWMEQEHATGIQTGYSVLDGMLPGNGLQPGSFTIIAGRPSMGKSTLAWCIAEHAAAQHSVAYFSLESSRRELGARALRWHNSKLDSMDEAVNHLSALSMMIDDTPAIGLAHMRIRLRRIRRRRGLHMVVVDYLQLMSARSENRVQEISTLSRGLKAIAKEFEVPVIAVAQINRAVEGRTDRRPMMSDLRESGQLEQDADHILMVYREEYYEPEAQHMKGYGEVLVRKNRDGPVGDVLLQFNGPLTRWIDYTGPRPVKPAEPKAETPKSNVTQFQYRQGGE